MHRIGSLHRLKSNGKLYRYDGTKEVSDGSTVHRYLPANARDDSWPVDHEAGPEEKKSYAKKGLSPIETHKEDTTANRYAAFITQQISTSSLGLNSYGDVLTESSNERGVVLGHNTKHYSPTGLGFTLTVKKGEDGKVVHMLHSHGGGAFGKRLDPKDPMGHYNKLGLKPAKVNEEEILDETVPRAGNSPLSKSFYSGYKTAVNAKLPGKHKHSNYQNFDPEIDPQMHNSFIRGWEDAHEDAHKDNSLISNIKGKLGLGEEEILDEEPRSERIKIKSANFESAARRLVNDENIDVASEIVKHHPHLTPDVIKDRVWYQRDEILKRHPKLAHHFVKDVDWRIRERALKSNPTLAHHFVKDDDWQIRERALNSNPKLAHHFKDDEDWRIGHAARKMLAKDPLRAGRIKPSRKLRKEEILDDIINYLDENNYEVSEDNIMLVAEEHLDEGGWRKIKKFLAEPRRKARVIDKARRHKEKMRSRANDSWAGYEGALELRKKLEKPDSPGGARTTTMQHAANKVERWADQAARSRAHWTDVLNPKAKWPKFGSNEEKHKKLRKEEIDFDAEALTLEDAGFSEREIRSILTALHENEE